MSNAPVFRWSSPRFGIGVLGNPSLRGTNDSSDQLWHPPITPHNVFLGGRFDQDTIRAENNDRQMLQKMDKAMIARN